MNKDRLELIQEAQEASRRVFEDREAPLRIGQIPLRPAISDFERNRRTRRRMIRTTDIIERARLAGRIR